MVNVMERVSQGGGTVGTAPPPSPFPIAFALYFIALLSVLLMFCINYLLIRLKIHFLQPTHPPAGKETPEGRALQELAQHGLPRAWSVMSGWADVTAQSPLPLRPAALV